MLEPKLQVALTVHDDVPTTLSISRNDNALFNQIDWPLATLAGFGRAGACQHLGRTVLRMLEQAHPASMAPYPALLAEDSSPDDAFQYLLQASFTERTDVYLGALDALLARHGTAISALMRSHWDATRARIVENAV
jgi:hypothetical protein